MSLARGFLYVRVILVLSLLVKACYNEPPPRVTVAPPATSEQTGSTTAETGESLDKHLPTEIDVVRQEQIGRVIVMVASGWMSWPTLPQCTYGKDNRFTNPPCMYGGMTVQKKKGKDIEIPLEKSTPEDEPLPPLRWKVSRPPPWMSFGRIDSGRVQDPVFR